MSQYHVFGTVKGNAVDEVLEALNGAEAIKHVARQFHERTGKDWKRTEKQFFADHVHLNATQLDPIGSGHTPRSATEVASEYAAPLQRPSDGKDYVIYDPKTMKYVSRLSNGQWDWTSSPDAACRFTRRDAGLNRLGCDRAIRDRLRTVRVDSLPEYRK